MAIGDTGASAADRALWFDAYITTYLERDLRDLAAVADLTDFQRLMQAAALRIGNLLNQSELGRDVQLPAMKVTVAHGTCTSRQASRLQRTRFSKCAPVGSRSTPRVSRSAEPKPQASKRCIHLTFLSDAC